MTGSEVADRTRSSASGPSTVLSWSGGKDAALALQALRAQGTDPVGLLTTVTEDDGAVAHHVPAELLLVQAAATCAPASIPAGRTASSTPS